MVDLQKAIEQIEKNLGRKLTDEEKNTLENFGAFMNALWDKTDGQEEQ